MRVLVAGSTGVIGRRLMPLLSAVGHEAVGMSRSRNVDALDREATFRFVRQAAPDAIVNLLTAIPRAINPKRMDTEFALTNRLRTEGTRNLVAAAPGARIVAEGLAYAYQPGDGPADEDVPLWSDPPRSFAPVVASLVDLERQVAAAGGVTLRFGHLTGPGSVYDKDGSTTRAVLARKMPVVGDGGSTLSFTHAHDAATAIVAALDRDVTGVLNVVDDTPIRMAEFLPAFALELGARPPMRVPAFAARMLVGAFGVAWMTRLRGADNSRARLRLDWRPRYAGFFSEGA